MDEQELTLADFVEMLKYGLAAELGGLNEEDPRRALIYAVSLLRHWADKLAAFLSSQGVIQEKEEP